MSKKTGVVQPQQNVLYIRNCSVVRSTTVLRTLCISKEFCVLTKIPADRAWHLTERK